VSPALLRGVYPTSSATVQETLALPSIDLPVGPRVTVLAVPQLLVVISAVPSNRVPLMFLAVASLVAATAVAVESSLVAKPDVKVEVVTASVIP